MLKISKNMLKAVSHSWSGFEKEDKLEILIGELSAQRLFKAMRPVGITE